MLLSGATFVRNGIKFRYPFVQSILSILPICDEMIVNVGDSEDETLEKILALKEPKIKIVQSKWNEKMRSGGNVLSFETNIAIQHCSGGWVFYLQADEVVHENDLPRIKETLIRYLNKKEVEAFVFDFIHFYGSYFTYQSARNWYRREVRIIRNNLGIKSVGDAQGFRLNGRKLKSVLIGAKIYHYGWARNPVEMLEKQCYFQRFWDAEGKSRRKGEEMKKLLETKNDISIMKYIYNDLENLKIFEGTHPSVMKDLINRDSLNEILSMRKRYANIFEMIYKKVRGFLNRIYIGEHKNYKLLNEKYI